MEWGLKGALENGRLGWGWGQQAKVLLSACLGECPGCAAVRAAGRAGTEPGRPHGPGGPARPAPAAKLKGGRSLSSPLPIAPPRAPGGAQAGPTSGPRVTEGGDLSVWGPSQPNSRKIRTEVPAS